MHLHKISRPVCLASEIKHGTLTLLYSSKEEKYNNAVALREFLLQPDV